MTDYEQGLLGDYIGKLWGGWYTDEKAVLVADLFRRMPYDAVRSAVSAWWQQNPDAFRPKLGDIRAAVQARCGTVETVRVWGVHDERSYVILNEQDRFVQDLPEVSVQDYCRERGIRIPSVPEREDVISRTRTLDNADLEARGRRPADAAAAYRSWLHAERDKTRAKNRAAKNDPKGKTLRAIIARLAERFTLRGEGW